MKSMHNNDEKYTQWSSSIGTVAKDILTIIWF